MFSRKDAAFSEQAENFQPGAVLEAISAPRLLLSFQLSLTLNIPTGTDGRTGVVNAPAFDEIQAIPTILEDVKTRSMADIATSYILPGGFRYVKILSCTSLDPFHSSHFSPFMRITKNI